MLGETNLHMKEHKSEQTLHKSGLFTRNKSKHTAVQRTVMVNASNSQAASRRFDSSPFQSLYNDCAQVLHTRASLGIRGSRPTTW